MMMVMRMQVGSHNSFKKTDLEDENTRFIASNSRTSISGNKSSQLSIHSQAEKETQ